jgi:hypothetical protein
MGEVMIELNSHIIAKKRVRQQYLRKVKMGSCLITEYTSRSTERHTKDMVNPKDMPRRGSSRSMAPVTKAKQESRRILVKDGKVKSE